MPVYVYRCASCGHQFERHQFFHDEPLKICPSCRKKTLKKVITPSKVIFKGSGFYSTDNKSPSGDKPSSGNNSSSTSKSKEGKSEKKEESKSSESKSSETKSSETSE
ncbi:MAG TPA: zinc ribbon domain-containing protein [Anaerolineales bacterium]|nr:zinc ribbon domain-containing protein [Anaerolineales bacterium]